MKKLIDYLATIATTAWVGGLWAVGYLAVPVLFHAQPDRQLAGMLAGQMFIVLGYLGMTCGSYLLIQHVIVTKQSFSKPQWIILVMLLITLTLHFGIQPLMADMKAQVFPLDIMLSNQADSFKRLHGISSIFFLLESLLGGYLVVKRIK